VTSFKQTEANRRNALNSTGPTTSEGKQRSRRNSVRHGLTAETVIGALEDAEDYKGFESAIIADYDAQTAVERELVLRLASLLWRLRRATTMETGLLEIQARRLDELRRAREADAASGKIVYARFRQIDSIVPMEHRDRASDGDESTRPNPVSRPASAASGAELARCFLRLANLPSFPLDRLSRYEATLWRQACQIMFTLNALERRKPQERTRQEFSLRHEY
jgi:hypothetical protein